MIAVYSLWNMGKAGNTAGFNTIDDLMAMMKLSMLQSRKYFDKVIFVTDTIGAQRADDYDLPIDEVRVEFDQLAYSPDLWAMPKLLALRSVAVPGMMHIDNDFIWWHDPALYWADADMLFQCPEPYTECRVYDRQKAYMKESYPHLYRYVSSSDHAYNCGVIGIRNQRVLEEWITRADTLIDTPGFLSKYPHIYKGDFNLIFEQAFAGSLCAEWDITVHTVEAKLWADTRAFTHLLASSKQNQECMEAVRHRLRVEEKKAKQQTA